MIATTVTLLELLTPSDPKGWVGLIGCAILACVGIWLILTDRKPARPSQHITGFDWRDAKDRERQ